VVGTARLGDNGFYEEISSVPGSGDGLVDAYSNDPNAFALRVRGDSMFPAIRDGWYVVVEPNSVPQPGDYVLVKLKSGQKMVKELLMQRTDSITVSSVNGDVRKTIDIADVEPHFGLQPVAAIISPKKWRPV
jgi:phage repressor protein C with HTH and peptisase S24 domain